MAAVPTGRLVKDGLYEQFARIGKAVAHPKRIELLDLLCQGERSVEVLADAAAMTVVNTSAHLRVLRESRLVATRKEGTRVFYRLADDAVCEFFFSLRDLAGDRYAEVDRIVRDFFDARDELEPVNRDELLSRAGDGGIIVLDVRPREEYEAGHIPGAVSIPLADLKGRMASLPHRAEVVAYCRGPYCVLAPQALELLRRGGFTARRLEDGFPEWRRAGLPVATGESPSVDPHPPSTPELTGP
ncbi:MAG: metalloregulator ArsR/SmtB family transcription factor [Actinomycetota bacterium]|nr:metalloregulator ArsR/SmtB family transcription factor [Actinomycetota bacterium]